MQPTLEVTPRTGTGKGFNRKARAEGKVPAIVYGPTNPSESVTVDPVQLTELFKESGDRNTIVSLKIGEKAVAVLVREVQRHPVSRAIVHVDFYAVPETEIRVEVPVAAVGKPKGAVVGGRVRIVRRVLPVMCKHGAIPKTIDIDVTPLDVGDSLSISQLTPPVGVKFVFDNDFKVIALDGKVRAEEEAPATPAAGAAAAAPAADAKAAPAKKG
jgi:large subunit ribosomal protein L25